MRKRVKPRFSAPKAWETIPLSVTRVVGTRKPAVNDTLWSGKQNYLVKSKPPAKAPPAVEKIKKQFPAKGQFIGDGTRLTAFVWLDDTEDMGDAANDK
jgi:hypothetical protein